MRAIGWIFLAIATTSLPCRVDAAGANELEVDLQLVLERTIDAHPEIPSLSLTILSPRHGIRWTGATGYDGFNGKPIVKPRPFRIASSTKPFVSATLLRLAEEGRLSIASPIARLVSPTTANMLRRGGHDPEVITVRHLMEHSAGLPDHVTVPSFVDRILKDPQHHWTRSEQIALAMAGTKPLAPVGEAYSYSDTGYVILGEIIERASGTTLAKAVRQFAEFETLSLQSTWWEDVEDAPEMAAPRVHQYLGDIDTTSWNPAFDLHGGGGLVSTTPDLAEWYRAVLTGGVFKKPETLAVALATPRVRVADGQTAHAPLMPVVLFGTHQCWGHGGFFGTMVLYCPDIDIAVAASVNMNSAGKNSGMKDLLDGVAQVISDAGIR
jgi:D-alanyl-D-alanine carboxypeptidase